MPNHLFTTSPNDLSALRYRFEGILGYIFSSQAVGTKALHHWRHPTVGDNLYTRAGPKEAPEGNPSSRGYVYQGMLGYVYPDPMFRSVPLLRWRKEDDRYHFYTTDPSGDIAPSQGFLFDGIAFYLYPLPMVKTTPLFHWYREQD